MGNLHGKAPWLSIQVVPEIDAVPGYREIWGPLGGDSTGRFFSPGPFWSVEAMAIISWRIPNWKVKGIWRKKSMLQESSLELGLSAQLAVCIVGCPKFFPTFGLNQPSPCRSGSLATQDWVVDSCLLWMSNEQAEELKESLYLAPDHAICFKCPSQPPGSSHFQ